MLGPSWGTLVAGASTAGRGPEANGQARSKALHLGWPRALPTRLPEVKDQAWSGSLPPGGRYQS